MHYLFSYTVKKTKAEVSAQKKTHEEKERLRKERREEQEKNVARKKADKGRSKKGVSFEDADEDSEGEEEDNDDDDGGERDRGGGALCGVGAAVGGRGGAPEPTFRTRARPWRGRRMRLLKSWPCEGPRDLCIFIVSSTGCGCITNRNCVLYLLYLHMSLIPVYGRCASLCICALLRPSLSVSEQNGISGRRAALRRSATRCPCPSGSWRTARRRFASRRLPSAQSWIGTRDSTCRARRG